MQTNDKISFSAGQIKKQFYYQINNFIIYLHKLKKMQFHARKYPFKLNYFRVHPFLLSNITSLEIHY